MSRSSFTSSDAVLARVSPEQPVLIAGPTASGKSALALEIAATQGGIIVNADASQVYACWRILTARPSEAEEAQAPHRLYGHVEAQQIYSTGHWLREARALLAQESRLIIVGGTGLYFKALTEGLAEIPATPQEIRHEGDKMPLDDLIAALDKGTQAILDLNNRARVQRAWEVQRSTGRPLRAWQAETPAPDLALNRCFPLVIDVEKDFLNTRIEKRFDQMMAQGALAEVAAVQPGYDPTLPAHRAIGAPELMRHLAGEIGLSDAREQAIIATRQFAKRQRTWMRNKMAAWHNFTLE